MGDRALGWSTAGKLFLGACMATAGRIVFEGKIAIDIILAEDGKYYADSTTTMDGEVVSTWTDGHSGPRPRHASACNGSTTFRH